MIKAKIGKKEVRLLKNVSFRCSDQELARYKEQREQPTHLPAVVREDPEPVQS